MFKVGALLQASFHKKDWTFEGAKANQIVLWGKGKAWGGELRTQSEKKAETENIPEGEGDQALAAEEEGEKVKLMDEVRNG